SNVAVMTKPRRRNRSTTQPSSGAANAGEARAKMVRPAMLDEPVSVFTQIASTSSSADSPTKLVTTPAKSRRKSGRRRTLRMTLLLGVRGTLADVAAAQTDQPGSAEQHRDGGQPDHRRDGERMARQLRRVG